MHKRRIATVLGFAACLLAGACQLLVGVDREQGVAPDAAADSAPPGDGSTDDATSSCQLNSLPDGTVGNPGPDTSIAWFAISTIRIRPLDAGPIGYDLDGRCTTTDPATASCRNVDNLQPQDDDRGGDNAFGRMIEGFVSRAEKDGGLDPAAKPVNMRSADGTQTLLLYLGGYDGTADDPGVSVALVPSGPLLGTSTDLACNADASTLDPLRTDAGAPLADGCDVWSYLPSTAFVPDSYTRPVVQLPGYVRANRLVVSFKTLQVALGASVFILNDGALTATITANGPRFALTDGIIAGRGATDDTVTAAARFALLKVGGVAQPLCNDLLLTSILKTGVCRARDVHARQDDDVKKLDVGDCDGISIAIGFDAVSARRGGASAEAADAGCPPLDTRCP